MTEYVGLDVSKEETSFCVKDLAGKVLARGKVATDPEALFEALKEHVKDKVGAWKYPRRIEFVTELPKTATGKIQRFKLREQGAKS